jgi:hypothetical protein
MSIFTSRALGYCGSIAVTVVLLSSCERRPESQGVQISAGPPASPSAQGSLGLGPVLAAVHNARFAIAQQDLIAAANDIRQARSFAANLPSGASAGGGVGVKLITAHAELLNGDIKDADVELASVQNGISSQLIPRDLPLLSANQSLALAKIDLTSGLRADLRTQLITAQLALTAYSGRNQQVGAKALAKLIGETLTSPGALERLQPGEVGLWAGEVDGWLYPGLGTKGFPRTLGD